jgi:type I restriction enzyme S subunit
LTQQKAIASILGALDDKIDLNRRMNETLEAIAQAIFKDWFVDFGPTRAKMEGRAPYLASEIWALFPGQLDQEGKPEEWEVRPLASIASLVRDAIMPASFGEELFDHYSIPAFDTGQTPVREAGVGILSNKTLVPSDAVLLSKLNPEFPRVWLVDTDSVIRSICSTEFLVLSTKVPADRAFLYSVTTESSFRQRLEAMVTGTSKSHQRVSPQAVLALDIIAAPHPIMNAFCEIVTPILDRVSANRRESRTLAATRDLLLPKLMSGEIRVKDAEKVGEAAA